MRFRSDILLFLIPYLAVFAGLNILKNAWVTILLYHLMILVYLTGSGHLKDFRKIFLGWDGKLFLISSAISIIAGPALFMLWHSMKLDTANLFSTLAFFKLKGLSWTLFIPYFCLLHPILEEVFWRITRFNMLSDRFYRNILFGGYHILVLVYFIRIEWILVSFVILSLVSFMWDSISLKTSGLIVPVLSHIIADSSIIILGIGAGHLS